ncbi:glycosyl transferase [Candidatus Woesebacteria bacterium RIFCSPLOWO2_01_FULL_39_21]|uniref:Glycosyl transferase n=1 Tax=Candidatus Woesebacteria bacterium RIFCSPLOWO2_01_FULL_39_21 TaxID=1802519 RepID=A0A1F8BD15_9BACT|nr:MAG: glycosyl transferase [Candidatus Woesebacteria bacterium RIFCSPHIGHO2_01_FULL_39_23]OGM61941.1 MAG: glycosyl transferase [Candidatus Woesebacteria bacterium RIFCSPLOWO2_01_FULL_39_21]
MKLTVIIPVFNEENTISELVDKVKNARLSKKLDKEIIVVDDGSLDKTAKILRKIKGIRYFSHKKNQGKGAAIKTGMKKARGEIVLIQDADLEYNPDDFKKLIEPILKRESDVVYGSRFRNLRLTLFGKNRTPMPLHYLGNKFLTFLTNLLYQANLTDMETCYKVFKKDVINADEIMADRFNFEPEFTAKILKKGIKIHEVPITVIPRSYNEGKKITWKDGLIAVKVLLRERFSK